MAWFDLVHARHRGLPVILLTSHGSIADAVAAMRRGLFGYLAKPVEACELAREVARAQALSANRAAGAGAAWRAGIITCMAGAPTFANVTLSGQFTPLASVQGDRTRMASTSRAMTRSTRSLWRTS